MVTAELRQYVKQQMQAGVKLADLRNSLLQQGWSEADVNQVMSEAGAQVTAQPLFRTQNLQPAYQSPTRSRPWGRIGLIVIGLLLLSAGAVWGYQVYWNNPYRVLAKVAERYQQQPVKQIKQDISLLLEIDLEDKSLSLPGTSSSDVLGWSSQLVAPGVQLSDQSQPVEVNMTLHSETDLSGEHPRSQAKIKLGWQVAGESQGDLGIRLVANQPDVFFLRVDLPVWLLANLRQQLASMGLEAKGINQWVKIDLEEVARFMGMEKQDLLDEFQSPGDQPELDWWSNREMLIITQQLESEKLDDQAMYHYQYELDKQAVLDWWLKANADDVSTWSTGYRRQMEEFLKQMGPLTGEVWIGKQDYLVHKVSFDSTVAGAEQKQAMKIKLVVRSYDFDQPVEITVPSDYIQLMDLIEYYISAWGGYLPAVSPDQPLPN